VFGMMICLCLLISN